jgi:hypothetical protein
MDIYKIYETDDYGRAEKVIGFVKSDSRENAKREYSIEHYGSTDTEICTTGYYCATKITMEDYHNERVSLIDQLSLYNI